MTEGQPGKGYEMISAQKLKNLLEKKGFIPKEKKPKKLPITGVTSGHSGATSSTGETRGPSGKILPHTPKEE